jgi:hypothetical protein
MRTQVDGVENWDEADAFLAQISAREDELVFGMDISVLDKLRVIAADVGYTLADPRELIAQLSPASPEQGLTALAQFAAKHFHIDLRWDTPTPVEWNDVLSIYQGIVLMCTIPNELYARADADDVFGKRTMKFRRDVSGACGLPSNGCERTDADIYVRLEPLGSPMTSRVARSMLHEFGHRLENTTLKGIDDVIERNFPKNMPRLTLDEWLRNERFDPVPGSVPRTYGYVKGERIATLIERFPFFDVRSFDHHKKRELDGSHGSVRARNFATIAVALARILDREDPSGKRKFLHYVAATRNTFTDQTTDIARMTAGQKFADTFVGAYCGKTPFQERSVYFDDGDAAKYTFSGSGVLSRDTAMHLRLAGKHHQPLEVRLNGIPLPLSLDVAENDITVEIPKNELAGHKNRLSVLWRGASRPHLFAIEPKGEQFSVEYEFPPQTPSRSFLQPAR